MIASRIHRLRRTFQTGPEVFYERFLRPHETDEDRHRRAFIFNVLILGSIALTFCAFVITIINSMTQGADYQGVSPLFLLVPLLVLAALYYRARRRFVDEAAYFFLLIFVALASYALYAYGYVEPEGLLTYVLVIVMAGTLISARAAFAITGLIVACLSVVAYAQVTGLSHPNLNQLFYPLQAENLAVYIFFMVVIVSVAWLSNRDLERSLQRARRSEEALRRERNSLEIKVRERTRELEQAQVEKMLELHRFAEFGRYSSTILHELASPLTSVSLELERLEHSGKSRRISHARKGIAYMEQYVEAARRQLHNQSEVKVFDSAAEITRVAGFLRPKATNHQLRLDLQLAKSAKLYGDSIKFDQVIANLIANAIDACVDAGKSTEPIRIETVCQNKYLKIAVRDCGIGIAADEIGKIFEPFYTTKTSERGTGIGLAITRRVVEEEFGGTIAATSTRRRGTCFEVRLPLYVA